MPDGTSFREFVLLFQDDLNLRYGNGSPIEYLAESEDAEDTGQKGFNYRTEPLWFRMGYAPSTPLTTTRTFDFRKVLTNAQVGGDPETPLFQVEVGTPVRVRVLQPGGHARNHVFQMHGHIWEEQPYIKNSTYLGFNPLSEWKGAQGMHGPTNHFDVMLRNGAGGRFGVLGDYLFRDQSSFLFDGGLWGIMRVLPRGALGSDYYPYYCDPCGACAYPASTTSDASVQIQCLPPPDPCYGTDPVYSSSSDPTTQRAQPICMDTQSTSSTTTTSSTTSSPTGTRTTTPRTSTSTTPKTSP
jgi:hypothetical protein